MIKNFLFVICFFFFSLTPVFASSDYLIKLDYSYIFTAQGSSTVKQTYRLTNLTSQITASSFDIPVVGQPPTGLTAGDEDGPIKPAVNQLTSSGYSIHLPFNRIVAGKDKTKEFWISYSGSDLTYNQPDWHMLLPQMNKPPEDISLSSIAIRIPVSLGSNSVFSAPPISVLTPYAGYLDYLFSPDSLITSPLSGLIGNFRIFSFDLSYILPQSLSLLLPSDSSSQKIFINSIIPAPDRFYLNSQKFWQADFDIDPSVSTKISVTGFALIYPPLSSLSFPTQPQSKTIQPYTGLFSQSASVSLSWIKPWQLFPYIKTPGYLIIHNQGNSPIYSPKIEITSQNLSAQILPQNQPQVILPQSQAKIPVSFSLSSLFSLQGHQIEFSLSGPVFQSITYNVPDVLLISYYAGFILVFALLITFLAFFTYRIRSISFQKPKT